MQPGVLKPTIVAPRCGTKGALVDQDQETTIRKGSTAPPPDDPSKPGRLTDITKPSWKYILKRSFVEFQRDECTDLAAALTYFGVLSVFPALLAVVSLLGVFGRGEQTTETLVGFLQDHGPDALVQLLADPIRQLTSGTGAGLAFFAGLVGALWTASGFVGAFGRAMNRIYEVTEGRPIWKLRPINVLVTLVMVVVVVVMLAIVVMSGGIAQAVGEAIGLGDTALMVWNIAKWPLLLVLAITLISLLFYATPNVRQPKFRWLTPGAIIALLAMGLAGVAFVFYVSNFSKYNATYGIIGSVIILLLGLWLMNNALLFGAEVDAETERGRELQGGIKAEKTIQLPPRDTRQTEKKAEKHEELVEEARELRAEHGGRNHSPRT
jgi:membrane protein